MNSNAFQTDFITPSAPFAAQALHCTLGCKANTGRILKQPNSITLLSAGSFFATVVPNTVIPNSVAPYQIPVGANYPAGYPAVYALYSAYNTAAYRNQGANHHQRTGPQSASR